MEDYKEFAEFVADFIFADEEFDCNLFCEIACRKLVKLGLVKTKDGNYIYDTK